ncbi:TPA: phage replisome organizer N-terminal domain-containing protein [Listeria monocytogenes]|uniref:phage replisome organizer N-terminal domain-containing protein n=1 Tax=Listeria monocytogenes TaxID=1639 RepID=UPI000BDFECD1|nr:phage replisome organizer N-terminal domain-containing protein [Listeria monocytogenes]EAE2538685.1 DnaD domain protein [Listeria monocytogenes]EFS0318645.1 DnaD domain protein [Listeria monocytogenes]EHW7814310.1 phage replisome organizer N-terminal domain-containing protein [Listeria monocytogenes]EKZ7003598.1 phage replisome organizer N-terminal domain-containing protein [Listeria monocytogenes]MBC3608640.1 phage replisome organizer N-terminal domain-containing protein [Listeria monocyto
MSGIQWIKLSVNMFDDEKIKLLEKMPEGNQMLIVWIRLLALAGKTNDKGRIYLNENVPYTEDMLATLFNRDVGIIRVTLHTLQSFGMIQKTENGLIEIENWEKHQNVDGMERVREQTRKRVEKHREAMRQNRIASGDSKGSKECNVTSSVTVTQSNAIDIDKELDKDINNNNSDLNFKDFWEQNGFGMMLPIELEKLLAWVDDFAGNREIVMKALEVTSEQGANKRNYAYVNKILKNWENRGFKTIADVDAAEKQRQIELEQKYNKPAFNKYNKPVKQEILPDWFDKEQQEAPKKPEMTEEEKEALEKRVAEIKAKLAAEEEAKA